MGRCDEHDPLLEPERPLTLEDISDADIRTFKAEARAVDDKERVRACNAALGLPTGDGALGMLDKATCRARVAELIIRERTPGTSAARGVR